MPELDQEAYMSAESERPSKDPNLNEKKNHSHSLDKLLKEHPGFYKTIGGFVVHLLRENFGDRARQEAESVTQEVFARAITAENFPELSWSEPHILAWFKKVARFTVQDFIRHYSGVRSERGPVRPEWKTTLPQAWESSLSPEILQRQNVRAEQPQIISAAQLDGAVQELNLQEKQALERELGFPLSQENIRQVILGLEPQGKILDEALTRGPDASHEKGYKGLTPLTRARKVLAKALGLLELFSIENADPLSGFSVAVLDRAIEGGLEGRDLQIAQMYYQQGLSVDKIAAELGITQPAISQRLAKIRVHIMEMASKEQ